MKTILNPFWNTSSALHNQSLNVFSILQAGTEPSKSQCKDQMDVQHRDKFLTSCSINNDQGGSLSTSEMETCSAEKISAPAHHSFDSSAFTTCDVAPFQSCSDYHPTEDPVTFSDNAVFDKHKEVQFNNGKSEIKVKD